MYIYYKPYKVIGHQYHKEWRKGSCNYTVLRFLYYMWYNKINSNRL